MPLLSRVSCTTSHAVAGSIHKGNLEVGYGGQNVLSSFMRKLRDSFGSALRVEGNSYIYRSKPVWMSLLMKDDCMCN